MVRLLTSILWLEGVLQLKILTPVLTFTNPNNDCCLPRLKKLKEDISFSSFSLFSMLLRIEPGLPGVSHVSNQVMFPPSTMAELLSSKLHAWLNEAAIWHPPLGSISEFRTSFPSVGSCWRWCCLILLQRVTPDIGRLFVHQYHCKALTLPSLVL